MTNEEISTSLCYYDKRNPNHADEESIEEHLQSKGDCYCDNCFYGRTKLANELLKLKNYEKTNNITTHNNSCE